MAVNINVRWVDNTAALKRNLAEGLNQIEANTAAVEKMVQSFKGEKLIEAAHKYAAAVKEIGGVERLNASEKERINNLVTKAIEKYELFGKTAPQALHELAAATKQVVKPTEELSVSFGTLVKGLITSQAVIGAAKTAWHAIVGEVQSSIKAYADAEAAQVRLVAALRSQGQATPDVVAKYNALATTFQNTTAFSDDLINEMQALLVQVGDVMPSKMGDALKASTDLAAGLGIDLNTATLLVAKAAAGHTETLGRYGITVDEVDLKTRGFTAVLEAVNRQFGGQAAAQIDTYAGRVKQMGNAWNNVEEAIGKFIVNNPLVIAGTRQLADGLNATDAAANSTDKHVAGLGANLVGMVAHGTPVLSYFVTLYEDLSDAADAANELASGIQRIAALKPPKFEAQGLTDPGGLALDAAQRLADATNKAIQKALREEALKKAREEAEKFAAAMLELNAASNGYLKTLYTIDGQVAEGIKFYLARGVAVDSLVKAYGVTKQQVEAVSKQMQFEQSVVDATTKAFGGLVAIVPDLSRRTQEFTYRMQGLTSDGLIPAADGFDDLARAELSLKLFTDQLTRSEQALQQQLARTIGLMPDLSKQAKEHMDSIRQAGLDAGLTYTQALEDSLQRIPDIFKQAFTGGGGVSGALKAVAIEVAESIGRVLAQRIAQSLAQSNAANAAAGIASSGGGGGGGGSVATKVAATIVTAGIYAGTLAVIALYKHFHDAEWEKLGKDIGRDLGVSLSESLLRAMEEDSKKLGRQAATLLHLNEIIDEVGGIAAFGFDKATKSAHDLFSMIETGQLTVKQAGATFDTLFGNLAKELGPNGLASKGFVELIKLNERFGTKSAEVLKFVNEQVSKIVDGLMAFTSPGKAAADTLEDVKKQMEAIRVEREDLMKRGTLGDADKKRLDELNKQWEDLEKKAKSAQGVVDATAITSQNAATALGATVAVSFAEMIKAGTPILDIFKTLDPIIDQLQKQFEAAGFTGGLAFDKIREMAALAKDEVAGPVIQGIIGLGQALTGLNNIGALDQDTFSGLTEQISSMYDSLVKQGKGGPAALRLLQAPLQTVWRLVHDFGYEVDENTKRLLDEAEAQGIVGEKMKPINEQMLEATNKIADAVEYLAEVFGYLPKAAKDAADGISDNLSKIKVPKIKIPYEWETEPGGAPPYIPSPRAPLPFPGTAAVTPDEWRTATAQRGSTAVSVRLSPTVYLTSDDTKDPDRVVEILDRAMRQDTGLIRTKIERIAQKAAEDAVV